MLHEPMFAGETPANISSESGKPRHILVMALATIAVTCGQHALKSATARVVEFGHVPKIESRRRAPFLSMVKPSVLQGKHGLRPLQ